MRREDLEADIKALEELYLEAIESGDRQTAVSRMFALIGHLARSGMSGRFPESMAADIAESAARYVGLETRSIDEAFGVVRRGGKLRNQRRTQQLELPVFMAVYKLHTEEGMSLTKAYEIVGDDYAISAKTAERMYYACKNLMKDRKFPI